MLHSGTNTAVIGKLRIRSTHPGPQPDRQRLRNILANTSLSPTGLPSSAILVVQKLADPLPSRLQVNQFDLQPDPLWQTAMVSQLQRLLAQAVRPALEPVPAAAAAVLFLDRTELLACMALDWLSGTLVANWWWREFFRNADPISSLLEQWMASPQFAPAALSLLSKKAYAVAFVQRLPEYFCLNLLRSIVRTHGIPSPGVAESNAEDLDDGREQEETESLTRVRPLPPVVATSPEPPWLAWVAEASDSGLSPIKQVLLAQALMLVRVPSQARSPEFQARLLHWQTAAIESVHSIAIQTRAGLSADAVGAFAQEDVAAAMDADEVVTPSPSRGRQKRHLPIEEADRVGISANFQLLDHQPSGLPDEGASPSVLPFPAAPPPAAQIHLAGALAAPERQELSDVPADNLFVTLPPPLAESHRDTELIPDAAITSRQRESNVSVETIFGGCFFLLNVFLHLNLYSDFASPRAKNLELNIWDLLALVAAQFTQDEVAADPLWKILAALSGRSLGQLPGASFNPPREWHLPQEWLDAFPEPWEQQTVERDGRVVSLHPAGFSVIDVPADDDSQSPELDPVQRWLGWIAAYLGARLARAIGRIDAVDLLCRQPGRVMFTHTHVDVTFSLNQHPVELRLAGLDRDPGWLPAAGRYVAFHFE